MHHVLSLSCSQWFRSAVIKENAMPEGLMTLLFSNIDPIYEFHRGFLKELDQRLALWWVLPFMFLCAIRLEESSNEMITKTKICLFPPGRDALMLTSKGTTRGLVMWCLGTCVLLRWPRFASSLLACLADRRASRISCRTRLLSSSGIHQLPTEARWGVNRAGESHQEAEEAGDGLQRVWTAEGLLPAPQHIPAEAHPAPHALQTHPGATVQALFSQPPRSRRLQGSVLHNLCLKNWQLLTFSQHHP